MAGLAGWLGWKAGLLAGWLVGWGGGIRSQEEPNVDISKVLATFLVAGLAGWLGWIAGLLAGWLPGLPESGARRRQMLIFSRF